MWLIIVDGSTPGDPCQRYVEGLADDNTTIVQVGYNIGHGRGMHLGIGLVETKYVLIFDSDVVFVKSPVKLMHAMMDDDTYGVGYLEKTAYDGFDYGAKPQHAGQPYMWMLHPFFHLLNVNRYYDFHPYVHHGAPCYKAALDIHLKGLTDKIVMPFPGLGHTSGKGVNWEPVPGKWILHDTAGTRKERRRRGLMEIEQGWER